MIKVSKECVIILEVFDNQWYHCHRIRRTQYLNHSLHCKNILLAILGFERVKKSVSSIFCMTNNKKNKVYHLKVPHLLYLCHHLHCLIFVLAQAIVKYDVQLTAS